MGVSNLYSVNVRDTLLYKMPLKACSRGPIVTLLNVRIRAREPFSLCIWLCDSG